MTKASVLPRSFGKNEDSTNRHQSQAIFDRKLETQTPQVDDPFAR